MKMVIIGVPIVILIFWLIFRHEMSIDEKLLASVVAEHKQMLNNCKLAGGNAVVLADDGNYYCIKTIKY